jgi:predicted nucleotidyltransferase
VNVSPITLNAIKLVAKRLDYLREDVVLVGGAVTGLLLTSAAIPQIRATLDIDVIVEIASRSDYYALEDKLRNLGFKSQVGEGIPLCRWVVDEIIVDVMPTDPRILGFSNAWYSATIDNSTAISLDKDLQIRIAKSPYFLATKIEAFHGRGQNDYIASSDIEDIIMVIDGRGELVQEIEMESRELKAFLANEFENLISNESFIESLPCHLLPDQASQARVEFIARQINEIIRLGTRR